MQRYGSKRCASCIRTSYNVHWKNNQKRIRLNESIKKFGGSENITIDMNSFQRLMKVFIHECAITGKPLDENTVGMTNRPNIIPIVIGRPVHGLKDLVVVSSAITMRLSKQKGKPLDDKTRCVVHALKSVDVRDRIRAAHDRLDRIEAAEKKLREEEQGNAGPTPLLSA